MMAHLNQHAKVIECVVISHTSKADQESSGIFNGTFSGPGPVINIMFVSGSAVSIGGGDANVYTYT